MSKLKHDRRHRHDVFMFAQLYADGWTFKEIADLYNRRAFKVRDDVMTALRLAYNTAATSGAVGKYDEWFTPTGWIAKGQKEHVKRALRSWRGHNYGLSA